MRNVSQTIDSIQLEWDAPDDPNGDIQHYEICYKYKVYTDLPEEDGTCINTKNSATSFTVRNLSYPGGCISYSCLYLVMLCIFLWSSTL